MTAKLVSAYATPQLVSELAVQFQAFREERVRPHAVTLADQLGGQVIQCRSSTLPILQFSVEAECLAAAPASVA
jgi:hypothetical protein